MSEIPNFSQFKQYSLINKQIINSLIKLSNKSIKGKSYLLLHKNKKKKLHEILICQKKGFPIKPHININSSKSYTIIKGKMNVVFYNLKGKIIKKIRVIDKKNLYIRFKKKIIHTIVPISKHCIYFETVLGPHKKTKFFDF